jgi:DNA helicase-2/ATP-dependent DNA helicase PcrA
MDYIKDLNLEQKKAVLHDQGPLLIVAGAGTGKTTVITRKIAYLIAVKKVQADNILALTFTDKAAGEMEERVESLLPFGYFDLWISTFHAFGERILHEHALDIGLPNNFKLLSETEQWLLIRQNLDEFELDYYQPKGNPTKFIEALVKHFSRLKDENITPEQYLKYAKNIKLDQDSTEVDTGHELKRIQELANAYHIYQRLLLKNNALDFGDLITYTIQLFKERPAILNKYQQQFKYILVDEFQDTNYAQYDLIKMLAKPKNNLTVVGDDDQSIYKFRGASVSNILEFKKDFKQAADVILIENYRSGKNILNLAHDFIKLNNPYRLEAKLKIDKNLKSQAKNKSVIEYLHYKTQEEEANGIVQKIIELKKRNSWNDFAILIRANSQADLFMPYLERADVPYQFLASKGLFGKPIILDLLAYLRMLDNYHESRALYRVLNFNIFKFSHEEIISFLNYAHRKNISLYETLRTVNNPEVNKLLGLIEKHTQLIRYKTAGEVLLAFLEDSGYLKNITKKDNQKSRESVLYLNQFYKYIQKFETTTSDKSVRNFINEINLNEEAGEEGGLQPDFEEGPETVKIMTVHSAKGLEFKYVFVVNLVDKRFPAISKADPIAIPEKLVKETIPEGDIHLQEERRLFYVAMTRAKEGLFLTSAEDYGGARKKKLSRFLIEAGLTTEKNPEPTGKIEFKKSVQTHCNASVRKNDFLDHKFSFTQIKAFETCPWQYYLAHILKVPVPGKASLSFGKTMHHTLYEFFRRIREKQDNKQTNLFGDKSAKTQNFASLNDLLQIYDDSWIDDWYYSKKNKEEYYKKGKEILKEFYKLHENNWPKVKYLEKGFNIKIKDYIIKGAIDRIDIAGDKVEIIDYKTGKVPENKKDIEQLLLYALALKEIFKEKPEKITYYYLEENKPLSFSIDDKELKRIQEWILEWIEKILKSDFTATPGFHCKYCDFRSICEYRR